MTLLLLLSSNNSKYSPSSQQRIIIPSFSLSLPFHQEMESELRLMLPDRQHSTVEVVMMVPPFPSLAPFQEEAKRLRSIYRSSILHQVQSTTAEGDAHRSPLLGQPQNRRNFQERDSRNLVSKWLLTSTNRHLTARCSLLESSNGGAAVGGRSVEICAPD